jgi:hypothetical protein
MLHHLSLMKRDAPRGNLQCHGMRRQEALNLWHAETVGVLFHAQQFWIVSQVHDAGSANQSTTMSCNANVVKVPDHAKLCPSYMAGTER